MTDSYLINGEEAARAYTLGWSDAVSAAKLEAYTSLLLDENQRQNLISRPSEAKLWERHIADSAQLLEHVPRETYT